MARADRTDLPDGESGIFFAMGLDMKSLICPSRLGKYSRRLSTRRISFAVVAHAAGRRRIFIAPPSATENGFLLVREPIEYLPSLVGLLSARQSNDALGAIISTLHALETSLSHGAKWKALINKYIGTMPVNAEACAAEHNGSAAPPPRTTVSSAMTAKVGAAASDSQPAAPRALVSPLPERPPAVSC